MILREKIQKLTSSIYFEMFLNICIIFNTTVMLIQYDGQPKELDDVILYTNLVILFLFLQQ